MNMPDMLVLCTNIFKYEYLDVIYYVFNNKQTYHMVISGDNLDLLKNVLSKNGITSIINGKFLLIRDITPEIQNKLENLFDIELPLSLIFDKNYDRLVEYLENDPDTAINYLSNHLGEYPRFAKFIIDNEETSYFPEVIKLGELFLKTYNIYGPGRDQINSYITHALMHTGDKKTHKDLELILKSSLESEDTDENVRLRNRLLNEYIGLPFNFDFGFDIKKDADTILKLASKFAQLYNNK